MGMEYLGRGLQGVADVENATDIPAQYLATTINSIRTSGYAATGPGAGVYASDSLATATLAAVHPRFCKQSLDGRYWRLLPEASGFISVMQGGALGKGVSDDYAAIQAALDYAQSLGSATVYFPAGTYKVNTTPSITDAKGINLLGEGPDNTVISAGAMPAFKTTGWWRSIVEGLGFSCNGNTTGGAFQMDGHPGGMGEQGVTFRNCQFHGNYTSKYVFTNQLIAGSNGQGSENTWIGCAFIGTSNASATALFYNAGGNALQNTFIGCNFQAFTTGIRLQSGSVDILHCGFQAAWPGYDQIANDGWDVDGSYSSQGDTVTMTGCRTESLRIYKGGGSPAQISGFTHSPSGASNWSAGVAYAANTLVRGTTAAGNVKCYRVTTAGGATGGTAPAWPESGTVTDGGITWTQLNFDVFYKVVGSIAHGSISLGRLTIAEGINVPSEVRQVYFSRDDGLVTPYNDRGAGPLLSNCLALNALTGLPVPLKVNILARDFGMPEAGSDKALQFNIGNRSLVCTTHDATAGTPGFDMQIGPANVSMTLGQNYWGITGGWGFAQIAFANLAAVTRNGVVYFVTDGTPGSDPLTGSGSGCLAVRQNGAWKALSVGTVTTSVADGDKGDITVSSSGTVWSIDNGSVSLAKMANLAANSFIGNNTGSSATPLALTGTQATALLDSFTSTAKGLAPASGGGTSNFLRADGTWAAPAGSGGVTDGDKGDVTVSGSGAVWTIDNGVVSLAKQASVATGTVFYRKTAGTGDPEVQTLATLKTDLGLTGTNSGDQTITLTGDVTGSGTGSFAATVANNAVTLAKMATIATDSILGRATAATGNVEVLTALPFAYTGDVTRPADSNATTIANSAVTYAKMQNVTATDKLLGRSTAGAGVVEEIACTAAGRALIDDADAAAQRVTLGLSTVAIAFVIDGGGATITTGVKGDITIPFACTITEWTLLADQSGSIQIDIWKDNYANYPPVVGDSITASAKPLFSTATKGQSSTLTGWTTSIAAGDTLRFNVDSVTTCQRVTLSLKVTR